MTDSKPAARTRKPKTVGVDNDAASETVAPDGVVPDSAVGSETPIADAVAAEAPVTEVTPPAEVPVVAEPVAVSETEPVAATSDPAAVVASPAAAQPVEPQPAPHVLYIEAPQPPRKKGNRGVGSLMAIVSAVLFAAVYFVILLIVQLVRTGSSDLSFLAAADFWVPVVAFAVGFVVLVIIVNRAGWAAHVIGSFFVAVFVYFASAATLLLLHANQFPPSATGAVFQELLFSTGAIVAALVAREVSLWVGFAIAARGRRVKARNLEARGSYDREFAEKRAEYERENLARHESATGNTGLVR